MFIWKSKIHLLKFYQIHICQAAGVWSSRGCEVRHINAWSTVRTLKKLCLKEQRERDFPGGPVAKTPRSQCTRPGYDPWSGNWTPRATSGRSHSATKTWHINKYSRTERKMTSRNIMQSNKHCKVTMYLDEEGLILSGRVNKGEWHWYTAPIKDQRGQNWKE